LREELGDLPGVADCLDGIGGVVALRKQAAEAVSLAGAADPLRETLELPLGPMRRALRDRWLDPIRRMLDKNVFAVSWHLGWSLHTDGAIAFARSALDLTLVVPTPGHKLTPREADVAALVATGLTNRQIADQLVIAERTVATHIEHILAKLDFSSRTQIGIWAAEHGIELRP
jgi:non-specific serine/threonine protein kinase